MNFTEFCTESLNVSGKIYNLKNMQYMYMLLPYVIDKFRGMTGNGNYQDDTP